METIKNRVEVVERASDKGIKQTEEETEVTVQTFEHRVTKHIMDLAFVDIKGGSFADPTEQLGNATASICQLLEYTNTINSR